MRGAIEELVRAIRRGARHSNVGKYIGSNCTSVTLSHDFVWVLTGHHKATRTTSAYPPVLVIGKTILRTLMVKQEGECIANGDGMMLFEFDNENHVTMKEVL